MAGMSIPSKFEHELILFFYPSAGVLWHSPATLALTSAIPKLIKRPRPIGHVSIRIKSAGSPTLDFHTGMGQLNKDEGRKEVLKDGYGLGILFHDFKGRIEQTQELDQEVAQLSKKSGRLSFIRFEINREMAERMSQYLAEYTAKGAGNHYGGPHRPLFAEGGGCSAFAASFLTVSGLMNDELLKAWSRNHLLPQNIIGGPKGKKKVPLWKVLSTFSWAKESDPHEKYFIWDPDLMHKWTIKQFEQSSLPKERWNNSPGIIIHAKETACPKGPIFQGEPDYTRMGLN